MQTVMDAYAAHDLALKNESAASKCGPCPVCGGRDRFVIFFQQNNGVGSWYCRGCDKGGDLIEFYRHCDGLSYRDACRAAGLEVPTRRAIPRRLQAEKRGLEATPDDVVEKVAVQVLDRALWRTKATEFAQSCATHLTPESPAGRWLAARGLPPESWPLYGLGYNPGENGKPYLMRPRKAWGLAEGSPSRRTGKPRRALWLPRGVVIPRLVGDHAELLCIRRNNADLRGELENMKYYVIPGSDMTPLLLLCRGGVLPPDACALVVEAKLDAMAVHYAAGDVTLCLAVMTAKLRHLPQGTLDALRRCAVILVAMDYGDETGAGADGWRIWQETFPQARRWPVPLGKDPGDAFARGVDLRAWVAAGLPPALARLAMPDEGLVERQGCRSPRGASEEESLEEKSGRLQEQAARRAERLEHLRTFFPLHRLYFHWETAAMRLCLEGQELRLEAVGDDFRLYGHERWTADRRAELLRFVHRHGDLINRVAHECPAPTSRREEASCI